METDARKPSILGRFIKVFIIVVLLAAGGAAWAYFQTSAPQIKRKAKAKPLVMVDVLTVNTVDVRSVIKAMGTVNPSREITLKSRVSGEIQSLSPNFVPGGFVSKGDVILNLDPIDYQVQVQKAKSALEKAQSDLAIERGNQTIAREELRLLTETADEPMKATDLSLRKPQLRQARASVAGAEADLRMAQLNLARTAVYAPFNALVVERNVNLGSHISTQDSLATLVSTDEYWVKAVIPLDKLPAMNLSLEDGCPAVIRSQAGEGQWQGRAVRSTGKLNDKTRMAEVIVTVSDPFGLESGGGSPHIMLDDYVHVEIQGRSLTSVIDLPRASLRDGETVWVYKDGALDIRPVDITWKQDNRIFVRSGLESGEQIITSDLPTPVQGMKISVANGTKKSSRVANRMVNDEN